MSTVSEMAGAVTSDPAGEQKGSRGLLRRMANLRLVLFVSFTLIALIPVAILAVWVERSAYEQELNQVSERHLLLAQNLSYALNRYAEDAEAVFELATTTLTRSDEPIVLGHGSLLTLLDRLGFEHVCLIDQNDQMKSGFGEGDALPINERLPHLDTLRSLASHNPNAPVFSGVIGGISGRPTLYLLKAMPDGSLAVGAMETDYLVKLQRAISFGELGHSAIVDQNGRVLAHPNENWRLEMKDISKVSAVQKMMSGQTGVARFFSPALQADMIAGFTSAERTGWGVMVPQPLSELRARANNVQSVSILIGLVGFCIAIVLAWVLSRLLAAPIERIADVARSAGEGNLVTRVPTPPDMTPNEIQSMATAINQMLVSLQDSNEQLVRSAEESEAANRLKSHFMSNMSHEFRTPLNAIMGYSDAMRSQVFGPLGDAKYDDYTRSIHEAGSHLLGLVEEILELTRAEAGKLTLKIEPTSVAEAAAFTIAMLETKATDGSVELQSSIADDVPLLRTEPAKLRQILVNLLSNAVKFTPPGGFARIEASSSDEWAAVIRVTDNGLGIDPDDMEEVMKPFGQVASAFARNHGGTGLGLPLTKELVVVMGGTFALDHREGGGTIATVCLPLSAPMPMAPD